MISLVVATICVAQDLEIESRAKRERSLPAEHKTVNLPHKHVELNARLKPDTKKATTVLPHIKAAKADSNKRVAASEKAQGKKHADSRPKRNLDSKPIKKDSDDALVVERLPVLDHKLESLNKKEKDHNEHKPEISGKDRKLADNHSNSRGNHSTKVKAQRQVNPEPEATIKSAPQHKFDRKFEGRNFEHHFGSKHESKASLKSDVKLVKDPQPKHKVNSKFDRVLDLHSQSTHKKEKKNDVVGHTNDHIYKHKPEHKDTPKLDKALGLRVPESKQAHKSNEHIVHEQKTTHPASQQPQTNQGPVKNANSESNEKKQDHRTEQKPETEQSEKAT